MRESAQLEVRGRALGVAVAVGAVLLAGALWAAKLDYDSVAERYSLPLDIASAGYKALVVVALVILGRRMQSRAMHLLAVLVAVLLAGSLFVNSDWSDVIVDPVAEAIVGVTPLAAGFVNLAIIFVAAGAIASVLLVGVVRAIGLAERRAVWLIIGMLAFVGFFLGPINAISTQGYTREWLFAEDFGQVVGLAVLGGYVWGLVAATAGFGASPGANVVDLDADRH